jgi:hypothetical protein
MLSPFFLDWHIKISFPEKMWHLKNACILSVQTVKPTMIKIRSTVSLHVLWAWNFVDHSKWITQADSVGEKGAKDNIWNQDEGNNTGLEEIASEVSWFLLFAKYSQGIVFNINQQMHSNHHILTIVYAGNTPHSYFLWNLLVHYQGVHNSLHKAIT